MNLFLILVASWIIGGLVLNVLIRLLLKSRFHNMLYITNDTDFSKGYLAGITNLKMYYYRTGEIPDMAWLQKVEHRLLDTRTALDEHLDN